MKIIHVTNVVAPDKQGGLERYVRELAAEQVSAGSDVIVIAKRRTDEDPRTEVGEDGVRVFRYGAPSKRRTLFAVAYPIVVVGEMLRALKRAGVGRDTSAVFHAHFPIPALALVLLGKRFIYTFHAPVYKEIAGERQGSYALPKFAERVAKSSVKMLERFVLNRAETVVTLSEFVLAEARSMGVKHSRFRLVPGGIDVSRFHRTEPLAKTVSGAGLFTARRLVERTGVEQLVAAMPAILNEHPTAQLRIAGAGPRRDAIIELLGRLNLHDHVTLLGRVSELQLVEEYHRATLAVTPTQYLEGFGLATAEALAAGTPALVTPVGANPELVGKLSPDLIAGGAGPEALARAINLLLADRKELTRLTGAVASAFAASWSWSNVESAMRSVYRGEH